MRSRALRAAWLVAALAAGTVVADAQPLPSARSPAAITDFRVGNTAQMAERSALLARGEVLLSQGDTAAAIDQLDRAAMMLHAPDTEMALVRATLQSGDYRRALAFCAHTAGAHRETVAPSALYAWLLQLGGQDAYAARVLAEARTRAADDPVLVAAARELASAAPRADAVLLTGPQRIAPYAVQNATDAPVPAAAEVVASGTLIDAGRRALVPLSAIGEARGVWLRNGLGDTTAATLDRRIDALGLAVLTLARPLDPGDALQFASREPFAGSPGFAVAYVATPDAAPAWPWLHAGFFGGFTHPEAGSGARLLGIAMPPGPRGGPVFDAAGRLAGLAWRDSAALPPADPIDRFVSVASWQQALGDDRVAPASAASAPVAASGPARRMPNDEVYERALRIALQVIVAR